MRESAAVSSATHAHDVRPAAPLAPTRVGAAATAAIAAGALVVARGDLSAWALAEAAGAAVLVWLAAIDLEHRLVPNRLVGATAAAMLAAAFATDPSLGAVHALAALAAGGAFLAAALLRPGALGFGDVKLVVLLGALLGADVLNALAIGFGAVGVVALALVARDGRGALARHLPLVPFLAAGAIAVLLAG